MTSGPAGVSNHQADAGGFLGRQSEFAVVRSYSILIVFTRQSARHATTTPTCPRRSRCAPKLSTNSIMQNGWHAARISSRMDRHDIAPIVRRAHEEDLPDITSEAIFTSRDRGTASF